MTTACVYSTTTKKRGPPPGQMELLKMEIRKLKEHVGVDVGIESSGEYDSETDLDDEVVIAIMIDWIDLVV